MITMAFVIIFYQGTGGFFLGLWARERGGVREERWVEVGEKVEG